MQGDSGVAPPSLSTNSSPHVLTEVVVTATGGWGPRPRGWRRAPGRDVGGFRRRRACAHPRMRPSSSFSKKRLDVRDFLRQLH